MKKQGRIHWETQILLWIIILILVNICCRVKAQNLDVHLLRQINTPHELVTDGFFRDVSNSTFFIMVAVPLTIGTIGTVKKDDKMILNTCLLIGSTAVTIGLTDVLKHTVNRQRPFVTYKDVLNKSRVVTLDPSFPSGHSSSAFNTATFVSLTYPRWYIILPSFMWAGTVAYSRMYLGVHYPSDVIVGALIGSGTAYLTHVIGKRLNRK